MEKNLSTNNLKNFFTCWVLNTPQKFQPPPPQCNAQAEVFNKTVAKYLASFVDNSTWDWEQYIPTVMFSYNHSTTQPTPYELLYGTAADIQKNYMGIIYIRETTNSSESQKNCKTTH